MYNTPQDLLDALRATPDTIQALLDGVTHAQAAVARGGDENWSVVEVVCHLRDAEERALERMRSMRDMPDPVIAGYDQAALGGRGQLRRNGLESSLICLFAVAGDPCNGAGRVEPRTMGADRAARRAGVNHHQQPYPAHSQP